MTVGADARMSQRADLRLRHLISPDGMLVRGWRMWLTGSLAQGPKVAHFCIGSNTIDGQKSKRFRALERRRTGAPMPDPVAELKDFTDRV